MIRNNKRANITTNTNIKLEKRKKRNSFFQNFFFGRSDFSVVCFLTMGDVTNMAVKRSSVRLENHDTKQNPIFVW